MSSRVLRYEVPVDDQWHEINLPEKGQLLHVAVARSPSVMEFWTIQDEEDTTVPRHFRVFGTGQPIDGAYCGTAVVLLTGEYTPLVWHLFERLVPG